MLQRGTIAQYWLIMLSNHFLKDDLSKCDCAET